MRIKFLSLVFTALFTLTALQAQSTIEEITTDFFEIYQSSPLKAIDFIYKSNEWMIKVEEETKQEIKDKFLGMIELLGDYYSYEKLSEKSIGENFKQLSFMLKYDRQPLLLTFILYKPKENWQIQDFEYNSNFNNEFENSNIIYYYK